MVFVAPGCGSLSVFMSTLTLCFMGFESSDSLVSNKVTIHVLGLKGFLSQKEGRPEGRLFFPASSRKKELTNPDKAQAK